MHCLWNGGEVCMTKHHALSDIGACAQGKSAKGLWVYLAISFGLGWLIQIAASVVAIKGNPTLFTPLVSAAMFAPMLGVIVACKGLKKTKSGICGWKPQFRGRMGSWVAAWLAPVVLTVLGAVVYYCVFPQRFDPTAESYLTALVGPEAYAAVYGQMSGFMIGATQVVNALVGAFLNLFFAVGEEAGWRGYLYPQMRSRFGRAGGNILSGLIWGMWHWPIMILVGYEYNYSIFNAPWYLVLLGMVLFCVVTVALGAVAEWCYETTGSIWAAALFHGGFNAAANLGILYLRVEYLSDTLWGPVPIGLLSALPLFIAASVLLWQDMRAE